MVAAVVGQMQKAGIRASAISASATPGRSGLRRAIQDDRADRHQDPDRRALRPPRYVGHRANAQDHGGPARCRHDWRFGNAGRAAVPGAARARFPRADLRHACADQSGFHPGRRCGRRRRSGADRARDRAEQLPDSNPVKKVGLEFRAAHLKANNVASTDAFSAYSFDGWLVFAAAAKRAFATAQPGTPAFRSALRDELYRTKELVGSHGVYNYAESDNSGVDERARVIVTLEKGQWKLLG